MFGSITYCFSFFWTKEGCSVSVYKVALFTIAWQSSATQCSIYSIHLSVEMLAAGSKCTFFMRLPSAGKPRSLECRLPFWSVIGQLLCLFLGYFIQFYLERWLLEQQQNYRPLYSWFNVSYSQACFLLFLLLCKVPLCAVTVVLCCFLSCFMYSYHCKKEIQSQVCSH